MLAYNEFTYKKTKDHCKLEDTFQKKGHFQSHILKFADKKTACNEGRLYFVSKINKCLYTKIIYYFNNQKIWEVITAICLKAFLQFSPFIIGDHNSFVESVKTKLGFSLTENHQVWIIDLCQIEVMEVTCFLWNVLIAMLFIWFLVSLIHLCRSMVLNLW